MYAAFWRRLPGPWPVRVLWCLLLLALVGYACLTWLYPWAATHLPGVDTPELGA